MADSVEIDWDDYRLVLAVANAGGLAGAAARRGVTLSTVFRNLERIERTLGVALFERLRKGYEPTAAGQEVIRAAERMQQEALAAARAVDGRDRQLTGTVRVTATETLTLYFLLRHLPAFMARHPDIVVEVISDNRRLSLADREADIALRPMHPNERGLVGQQIARLAWGIYASSATAAQHGRIGALANLEGASFIGWNGSPAASQTTAWLLEHVPAARIPLSSNSLVSNAVLATSTPRLVQLPCFMAAYWPELEPLFAPVPNVSSELWVITHEDLARNARVRALVAHLVEAAKAWRPYFLGTGTTHPPPAAAG